jgi:hypothetical protein
MTEAKGQAMPSRSCIAALLILYLSAFAARADERCLFYASPGVAKSVPDACRRELRPHTSLPEQVQLPSRRGTVVVRLTPKGPFGGFPALVENYPGPPHLAFRVRGERPKPAAGQPAPPKDRLHCVAEVALRYARDGNALETIKAEADLGPGRELHVAWTWSGVKHVLYLNGKQAAGLVAHSPLPPELKPPLRLLSNYDQAALDAAPVAEIAGYNFAMTPEEVAQDCATHDDQPLRPTAASRGGVVAQWAPGERRAYIALDSGGQLAGRSTTAKLHVQCNGQTRAEAVLTLGPDGFGETLIALTEMPAGRYRVEAVLRDAQDRTLATLASDAWELPNTPWLGNTKGLTDRVQPPWTPVERDGLTLKVWGRAYELQGGFGLPQQIVSQGRKQLAQPVTLELMRAGQTLTLTEALVQVTSVEPHRAQWRGTAACGGVRVRVDGQLEYDGMVRLALSLEPRGAGTFPRIDAIRLQTVLPRERALFLNTATDQGYWWYSYKAWLPEKPGVLHDNLRQKSGRTSFLFFVLFSDYDTGLEWFADNLAGWHVDESKPVQEIIRQPNGDVRLQCHLANMPLEVRGPVKIEFGYDATPVKPLPPDWRSAYVHHHPLKDVKRDLAMWWLWSDSRYDKFRPNVFLLRPDDLAGFASLRREGQQVHPVKLAPFVNQHVTVPTWPENQAADKGWPWFHNLLQAESANDGWTAMPTRGIRDYWASNLDQWIASGGLDAIYIDEANCNTVSSSLLTGSGYRRPDGTHAFGHNTLGMREQLKRVRQLFLDHGRRPIVWIPVYGMIIPHAYAFVDVVSEGEAFMFEKPDQPDWIDVWGADFLKREPGPGARGGPWLRSLGPAQKFGFIPIFLNYIRFYNDPRYLTAMRAQYALLGLLDVVPISPELGWFFKAKQDFGMGAAETSFHRFFEQTEFRPGRADVLVSYYRRGRELLLIASNLGREPYRGTIHADWPALQLAAGEVAAVEIVPVNEGRNSTEYREAASAVSGAGLEVMVPPHDFKLLRVRARAKPGP